MLYAESVGEWHLDTLEVYGSMMVQMTNQLKALTGF